MWLQNIISVSTPTTKYCRKISQKSSVISAFSPNCSEKTHMFSQFWDGKSHPIPHPPSPSPPFFGDMVPSLGKGYGKGAFGAPKEAKGLVRAVVSAQVVPGGKWNNDDNTSPGRDGGMGGWGTGDGGKGRHIHIYNIYIYISMYIIYIYV